MINILPDTSTDSLLSRAMDFLYQKGNSFAAWRLPGSPTLFLAGSEAIERWPEVNLENSKPGFLVSPFEPSRDKIFIPADTLLVFEQGRMVAAQGIWAEEILRTDHTEKYEPAGHYHFLTDSRSPRTDAQFFKDLVIKAKAEIARGTVEKLVASRTKRVEWLPHTSPSELFNRLNVTYPQAMVSIVSSPLTGTWMGASPELLVKITADQHFHTVAVAGTQPFHDGLDPRTVAWAQKDIEEQALVERYVISCFKKIRLREYEEHGPKTMIAGNVLHLKTDFEVDMVATNFPQLGSVMLNLLHPTSAVCGMPLEASLQFLLKHENYERQYYSGYLGPVNVQGESQVYVNLRCMQLFPEEAILYAGAGIMADSDPEKEWMETEMKMNTLLRIIRQ